MPRLPPSLFRRAALISPYLATLLPACRTVASARSELRWIRGHVLDSVSRSGDPSMSNPHLGGRRKTRARARARTQVRLARMRSEPGRGGLDAAADAEDRIARLVARRGAGEPLQYVLGTQPFADLEVLCEKGVLIPRAETEAWASALADLLLSSSSPSPEKKEKRREFRILDLCSGTGCIALSLYARMIASRTRRRGGGDHNTYPDTDPDQDPDKRGTDAAAGVRVFGFDIEPRAIRLARRNLARNFPPAQDQGHENEHDGAVSFHQADIFTSAWMAHIDERQDRDWDRDRERKIDVLVSNPPYISQDGFARSTGRSVRNHEPKLALVPSPRAPGGKSHAPEDVFYARLLDIADALRPRVAVFEVGDMEQATRVAEMAMDGAGSGSGSRRWGVVEIWRDWPDCRPSEGEEDVVRLCGRNIPVRGSGHGRAVFLLEGEMVPSRLANRGFRRDVYTD
ncbi:S-adenosyl-L-methionine-dependent methyltransferase [Nemania sp. NC0429]|nr:S-adenosyl-L-methionine-dependent methyltransferase [Nemania sp. NC0429]